MSRMEREKETLRHTIVLYCRGHHDTASEPCADCGRLLEHAVQCLERCPYQQDKPVCGICPTHCYEPAARERIRRMMRFTGPRMLVRHPVLTILHIADALRMARVRTEG